MKEIGKFLPKWRILQLLMLFSDFITDHVFYLFALAFYDLVFYALVFYALVFMVSAY